ncbi:DUF6261 family protein [Marinifilum flexuosum]|uniref:DUF6261 family protein n=1 Tax=Marinifilum flexuosum TaxID=1117708 RepID=UPI00248FC5CC|nr:DUF6261 family protein [Marinifilum flexuosum]
MHLTEYLVLATKASAVLAQFDEVDLQLIKPKENVKQSLTILENSMKTVKSSFRTQELSDLDLNRDDSWKCLYYFLISQSYSSDPEIRKYAIKLLDHIRTPEMRIYKMGYQEQTACMINFFNKVDSSAELTEAIEKTGSKTLYEKLKSDEGIFEQKSLEKDKEESEKPNAEGAKAAKEVRKAIEALDRFLSVMKDLSGKEEYDNIAAQINETAMDINTQVTARLTRLKNAKEEEETTLHE